MHRSLSDMEGPLFVGTALFFPASHRRQRSGRIGLSIKCLAGLGCITYSIIEPRCALFVPGASSLRQKQKKKTNCHRKLILPDRAPRSHTGRCTLHHIISSVNSAKVNLCSVITEFFFCPGICCFCRCKRQ